MSDRTVRELVEIYEQMELDNLSPRHQKTVTFVLGLFVAQHGNKDPLDLRGIELLKFVKDHPSWKSPSSQKSAIVIVKRLLSWSVESDLISYSPLAKVRYRGKPAKRRRPMSDEAFQALLRVTDPVFRRFLVFLKFSGARPGEVSSMRWRDIRFDEHSVVLAEHKTSRRTRRPRIIPLVPTLVKLLVWIRQHRQASAIGLVERLVRAAGGRIKLSKLFGLMKPYGLSPRGVAHARLALGIAKERKDGCWWYVLPEDHEPPADDPGEADFVFINCLGNPMDRGCLALKMARARKRAGLPKSVQLYGLRHRYGLVGIKNRVNLKLLSLAMGHSRTEMTEHYISEAGLTEEVKQAALQIAYGPGAVANVIPPAPPRPIVITTPPPPDRIPIIAEHVPARYGVSRPQVPLVGLEPGPATENKIEALMGMLLERLAETPAKSKRQRTAIAPRELNYSHEQAYRAYQWALTQAPELANARDADVFAWLKAQSDCEFRLPPLAEAFTRYLRFARLHYDTRKRVLHRRELEPQTSEE